MINDAREAAMARRKSFQINTNSELLESISADPIPITIEEEALIKSQREAQQALISAREILEAKIDSKQPDPSMAQFDSAVARILLA